MNDLKKYYFKDTNDFGDRTIYWKDVTELVERRGYFKPDHDFEYVVVYGDCHVPYAVHNKLVDEYRTYPHNFSNVHLSMEDFNTQIKPHIINSNVEGEDKMNQTDCLAKNAQLHGITYEQLGKQIHDLAHQYVLEAIAQHERTKIDVSDYIFEIGQKVLKHTGDYHAEGTVIGRFKMLNGAVRYAVEHSVPPSGSFIHLYSEKNLKAITKKENQHDR